MQLQDMIQRVRWEIGEPSIPGQIGTQTGSWSDTQITAYLNDAQALLARPARLQADPATITLTSGTYSYSLPADCLEDGLRKLTWYTNNGAFEVEDVGYDQWSKLNDMLISQSNPIYPVYGGLVYAQWAGKVNLFPTPQNSTDTLTFTYYKKPAPMANITDTSQIADHFHIVLVNYAIAKCQAAAEESQLQMLAMQEFERIAAQLAQERTVENRDRPGRVRLRR